MKIYIYACEAIYQGYHGVEDMTVIEVDENDMIEEIVNEYGYEMSHELIESYGLEERYMENAGIDDTDEFYENYDEITCDCSWSAFKIKDNFSLSIQELSNECFRLGDSLFRKKYCEEDSLF